MNQMPKIERRPARQFDRFDLEAEREANALRRINFFRPKPQAKRLPGDTINRVREVLDSPVG